jgi:DNA invertase Pin-like site-specific DNA recombinase
MKVAIYVRTNENHEKMTTKTAAQLFRLYTYAIEKGYEVSLKHIYTDTGSANFKHRPGFEKLVSSARAEGISKLLVTGLDRLARSAYAAGEIDLLMQRLDISIEVVG